MTTFTHLFQSQLNLTVESQMCEEEREGGQWGFLGQFPDVNSPLPLPLSPYFSICPTLLRMLNSLNSFGEEIFNNFYL